MASAPVQRHVELRAGGGVGDGEQAAVGVGADGEDRDVLAGHRAGSVARIPGSTCSAPRGRAVPARRRPARPPHGARRCTASSAPSSAPRNRRPRRDRKYLVVVTVHEWHGEVMDIEQNKQVLARFDRLLGTDDLSTLDAAVHARHGRPRARTGSSGGTRRHPGVLQTMGRSQMTHEGWHARRRRGRPRRAVRRPPGVARRPVHGDRGRAAPIARLRGDVRFQGGRIAARRARRPDHAAQLALDG